MTLLLKHLSCVVNLSVYQMHPKSISHNVVYMWYLCFFIRLKLKKKVLYLRMEGVFFIYKHFEYSKGLYEISFSKWNLKNYI